MWHRLQNSTPDTRVIQLGTFLENNTEWTYVLISFPRLEIVDSKSWGPELEVLALITTSSFAIPRDVFAMFRRCCQPRSTITHQ